MSQVAENGPLLEELLQAQLENEDATSYPRLESYCAAVEATYEDLEASVVWPIGAAAERLAGAAVLFSRGHIRLRGWSARLDSERVLLLAVAEVTPISLIAAAQQARALGASAVVACGVTVQGAGDSHLRPWIDEYVPLETVAQPTGVTSRDGASLAFS